MHESTGTYLGSYVPECRSWKDLGIYMHARILDFVEISPLRCRRLNAYMGAPYRIGWSVKKNLVGWDFHQQSTFLVARLI